MAHLGKESGMQAVVQRYFDKLDPDNQGRELSQEEYKNIRDEALDSTYGKGFAKQYAQNKLIGQGSVGSVFEMPNDPSKVRKVQRTTEDVLRSPNVGIQRREIADDEVETQLKAMEAGVSPRLHSVETYPVAKRKYHLSYPNESKQDEVMHIMEMDKVSTVDDEGGIDEIIDKKVKNFGFDNTKDYPYKGTLDQKREFIDRKGQMIESEKAKYKLALSKTRLALADQGIVHTDLGYGREQDRREDHLSYDPYSNEMKMIDYNQVETFNHAHNLHEHTKNLNLKDGEFKNYTPGANVEHFLDHKVNAIIQGMTAVGNKEEAFIFKKLYEETVDSGDLLAADDLVNQGREIIDKHTAKDVDNKYLEFLKKRK
jgi:hypothetical protein